MRACARRTTFFKSRSPKPTRNLFPMLSTSRFRGLPAPDKTKKSRVPSVLSSPHITPRDRCLCRCPPYSCSHHRKNCINPRSSLGSKYPRCAQPNPTPALLRSTRLASRGCATGLHRRPPVVLLANNTDGIRAHANSIHIMYSANEKMARMHIIPLAYSRRQVIPLK